MGRQSLKGGAHLIHPEREVVSDAIVWIITEGKIVCAYKTIPAWSGIFFAGMSGNSLQADVVVSRETRLLCE